MCVSPVTAAHLLDRDTSPPLNKNTTWGDRRMFEHPYKISSKAAHKYSYYVRMGAYSQIHL